MEVHFLTPSAMTRHGADELPGLLRRADGFVWVDVPELDAAAESLLTDVFGAHPLVVEACRRRNHVPTVHGYSDHVFVVLHSPLSTGQGHVHLLELDQLVGTNYLVTVHGPVNPEVSLESALAETAAVRQRIDGGRFRPATPAELSYAVVSALVRAQRAVVSQVAEAVPGLESRVMAGNFRDPEVLLEEMFLLRHELITVRTLAAQDHEIYARLSSLDRLLPEEDLRLARDLSDQFERVRSIADGESQFLFGVIDLYQTRVSTKMTLAMERLAVIAAITLPITAIASVYGMNVIVNERTHWVHLVIVLAAMATISGLLLRWAKKQGWW